MSRFYVRELGQEWPWVVGDMSFWMRLWYKMFVSTWFTQHQKRHPHRFHVFDSKEKNYISYADDGTPHKFWNYEHAQETADRLNELDRRDNT